MSPANCGVMQTKLASSLTKTNPGTKKMEQLREEDAGAINCRGRDEPKKEAL
jgi:hypothetical protein